MSKLDDVHKIEKQLTVVIEDAFLETIQVRDKY